MHEWKPNSHWDVHPDYPVEDWKEQVANDDTRLGYHEWVNHEIELLYEEQEREGLK